MKVRAGARIAGAGLVLGLAMSGCTPERVPEFPQPARASGELIVRGCTPAHGLIPAAATDTCALRVVDAINSRLFRLAEDGTVTADLAESMERTDPANYTIRLVRGRTFSNGTEITARNFVAAWNWAAYGPNKMPAASYFRFIDGADKMFCADPADCSKDGRPSQLTGLKVIDDYTFTLTTAWPMTDLQARLAHPAFAPLPDSFFAEDESKESFSRLPVTSGPYLVAGNPPSEVVLTAYEGYRGRFPAQTQQITVRNYDGSKRGYDVDKAYQDLVAGALDYSDVIQTDHLLDDQWRKDLGERSGQAERAGIQMLTFAQNDKALADPKVRIAISRGIDREALARQVFVGTRTPATSWVSPSVAGYPQTGCGELCDYDPVAARKQLTAAGGYPGQFNITVNGDGGNKQWADVLCNQLKNSLQLDCQVRVLDNQKSVDEAAANGQLSGLYHQDLPVGTQSAGLWLNTWRDGAAGNLTRYAEADFDRTMSAAEMAPTREEANAGYRKAEGVLAENPPSIPLWFEKAPMGWSDRVAEAPLNAWGTVDLPSLRAR